MKGKAAAVASKVRQVKNAFLAKLMGWQTVTMMGNPHSVYLEIHRGKRVVMMASDKVRLINKVYSALRDSKVQKNRELVAHLEDVQKTVKQYEDDIDHYKFVDPDSKRARELEAEMEAYSSRMISQLAMIGKVFELDILRGGKYVLDEHVHPDYQHRIRKIFYGSASDYEHHRAAKRQEAINAKLARFSNPLDHPDKFWCPGYEQGRRYPHLASLAILQLDHKEGVASHWRKVGHNSTQAVREQFFVDGSNIEALCAACNGAKKSDGDYFDNAVGPDFSGPGGLR